MPSDPPVTVVVHDRCEALGMYNAIRPLTEDERAELAIIRAKLNDLNIN